MEDSHIPIDPPPPPPPIVSIPHASPEDTTLPLDGVHSAPSLEIQDTDVETCTAFTGTLPRGMSSKVGPRTACCIVLSAFYAKLLVVVCIAFVSAEVITSNVPLYFYEAFFTYLYGLSILFLLYVFCFLLTECSRKKAKQAKQISPNKSKVGVFQVSGTYDVTEGQNPEVEKLKKSNKNAGASGGSPTQQKLTPETKEEKPRKTKTSEADHSHGSFFLRIGAIAFGLGSMIYCGLEFGDFFFEIPPDSPCFQILRGANSLLQMVFTFLQMYFIFMNSRLNIHKFKILARFGLMHVIGTNICVWIRTLVQQGLKQVTRYNVEHGLGPTEDEMILVDMNYTELNENVTQKCGKLNIMGTIFNDASPYLYPLLIEYSLIGAVVLYIMWKNVGRNPRYFLDDDLDHLSIASRKPHTQVDCIGASKGLFFGLLFLVAALICLIVYFVLVHNPDLNLLAIYLADVSHSGVLFLSMLAIIIGFIRIQQLKFNSDREDLLNDILLRISGFGIFLYSVFCAISGSLTIFQRLEEPHLLIVITHILVILEVILQILFVSDISRRTVHLPEHDRTKPGRQIVTFLLICNLTMWAIYTFEMQKVEANPVQMDFYGYLPWNILLRVCLPLSIFHRFHASVMLAEIWKTTYKSRSE